MGSGWRVRGTRGTSSAPRCTFPPHILRKWPNKNSTLDLGQAAPSGGAPSPLPSGAPFPSTLSPKHPPPPTPARRGALVRQGGGCPTAPGRGPRAGLGAGALYTSPGAPPRPTHGRSPAPTPPGGCVPEVGGAGGQGCAWVPGAGPLPSAQRMVGSTERVPGGARCPSPSSSRRRGLGDRCSSSSPSPRRLPTAAAPAGGAAVIPAPEEPAPPVPGGRGAGDPGRGGPNR